MNPQTTLQERYPLADFGPYFAFLESRKETETRAGCTHEHHICPRLQFPEYVEGCSWNLITLTLEDHAQAHKLLEVACGIKAAPVTYFLVQPAAATKGGCRAAELGVGWHSPEVRRKAGHKGGQSRSAAKSNGGRIGGRSKSLAQQSARHANLKKATAARIASGYLPTVPLHTRWHVNRGIVSAACSLCVTELGH
jgi:hypothetical protein